MSLFPSPYPNNTRNVVGTITVYQDDVFLYCNTASTPVTINLLPIPAGYINVEYRLYIKDISNNASTNNITIIPPAGCKINNSSALILNQSGQGVILIVGNNAEYISTAPSIGGHIIENQGAPLPQQPKLNFIGAGVAASDNPSANSTDVFISIKTDIINITYAALATLKSNSTLSKGQWYNVTDKGVILFATDVNNIGLSGYYKAYNADYQSGGDYTGVLAATGITPSGTNQGVWDSGVAHTVGKLVIWGGANWINNNGNIGSAIDDFVLSADWTKLDAAITPTTQGYIFEIDNINFDFKNALIVFRGDKRGNIFYSTGDILVNERFQWGNNNVAGNLIYAHGHLYSINNRGHILNNTISGDDSLIEATNNVGTIQGNSVSNVSEITAATNTGLIRFNFLDSASTITADANAGQIVYNDLSSGSQIIATNNSSIIEDNSLSTGGIIVATNNAGNISQNNINNSVLTATNQAGAGSIINNIITANSTITATANIGDVSNNNLSESSLIDATTNAGGIQNNLLANDSNITASAQDVAGLIDYNAVVNGSAITADTNAGTLSQNMLCAGSVINAAGTFGMVNINFLANASEIDATNNGNLIQSNSLTGGSSLNANSATAQILNNIFSTGANIDLTSSSVAMNFREFTGSGIVGGTQLMSISGAGAIDVSFSEMTRLTTTGGGAHAVSMADGLEGQEKFIIMNAHNGDATVTPSNFNGFTNIVFSATGQFVKLKFVQGHWNVLSKQGVVIS